jgi:hypothetical protein
MSASTARPAYSFEHGVDHVGYDGVAPILYVGGPVLAQDFVERDLSRIRGVSISQRGLPKGIKWKDLNLGLLFEALPRIEYLRVFFEDTASLDVIGSQPALRQLVVDCPKARGTIRGELPLLQTAELRWPDACTASMVAPGLENLSLVKPQCEDLSPLSHLSSLRDLGIFYARHFHSFQGLASLPELVHLQVRNCPNLVDLNSFTLQPGPRRLEIDSCVGLVDALAILNLTSLRELGIYAGERGPRKVSLPQSLASHSVHIDLRGVAAEWVQAECE